MTKVKCECCKKLKDKKFTRKINNHVICIDCFKNIKEKSIDKRLKKIGIV